MKNVINCINEASIGKVSPNVCDYSANGRSVTCWIANDKEFFKSVLPKLDLNAFNADFEEMDCVRITFNYDRNTAKVEFPDMWTSATRLSGLMFKCSKSFEKLQEAGTELKPNDLQKDGNMSGWRLAESDLLTDIIEDCKKIICAYFNNMPEPLF